MSPTVTGSGVTNVTGPAPDWMVTTAAEMVTPTAVPVPLFVIERVQTRCGEVVPSALKAMVKLRAGADTAKFAAAVIGPATGADTVEVVPPEMPLHCVKTYPAAGDAERVAVAFAS